MFIVNTMYRREIKFYLISCLIMINDIYSIMLHTHARTRLYRSISEFTTEHSDSYSRAQATRHSISSYQLATATHTDSII